MPNLSCKIFIPDSKHDVDINHVISILMHKYNLFSAEAVNYIEDFGGNNSGMIYKITAKSEQDLTWFILSTKYKVVV